MYTILYNFVSIITINMFKSPFSFNGRIRRLEFGLSILIYYAYLFLSMGLAIGEEIFVVMIPAYWFILAQGSKRCHDRGNSGWYQLIPFYSLWMLFGDSELGINRFGLNPKGEGNKEAVDEGDF